MGLLKNLGDLYDILFSTGNEGVSPQRTELEPVTFNGEIPFSGVPVHLQILHNMIYYIVVHQDDFDWQVVELAKQANIHLTNLSLLTHTMPKSMDMEITSFITQFCYNSRQGMLELNSLNTMAFYADKVALSSLVAQIRRLLSC